MLDDLDVLDDDDACPPVSNLSPLDADAMVWEMRATPTDGASNSLDRGQTTFDTTNVDIDGVGASEVSDSDDARAPSLQNREVSALESSIERCSWGKLSRSDKKSRRRSRWPRTMTSW